VDEKTGWTVTLQAGKYRLELAAGNSGLALSKDQLTLEPGGKEFVKVRLGPPAITEVRRYEGYTEDLWVAVFCLDGKRVLAGGGAHYQKGKPDEPGADFALRLWNAETGAEVRRLEGYRGPVV